MQYEYTSKDKDRFSLHDCRALSAGFSDGILTFRFPDGIFCADYSNDWPNTGKAQVEFTVDPMRGVCFYLFISAEGKTIRQEYTVEQLAEKINTHEWELEFAYRYDGFEEILYTGWIWAEQKPWTYECELWVGSREDTVFRWDPPAEQE